MCLPKAPKIQQPAPLPLPAPVEPVKAAPIPEAVTPLPAPEKQATFLGRPTSPDKGAAVPDVKKVNYSSLRIPLGRASAKGDINVPR